MYIKEIICGWVIFIITICLIVMTGHEMLTYKKKSFELKLVKTMSTYRFDSSDDLTSKSKSKSKSKSHILYDFDTFNTNNYISLYTQELHVFNTNEFMLFTSYIINNINNNVSIIVRLSSPGGFSYEYEKLYQYVRRLNTYGYTTIAFIDDICASGCYMMASGFTKIYASETAKIGSIGVIYEETSYDGIYNLLNISNKIYTAGEYKGSSERAITKSIHKTYELFKEIVMDGRNMDKNEIENVATGEMWYAKEAKQLKLIDGIILIDDYIFKLLNNNNNVYYVTYN